MNYEALRPYAETPTQHRFLDALRDTGSVRKAAKLLGQNQARVCDAIKRMRKHEARQQGADPGFEVSAKSTLRNANGEVVLEWTKTRQEDEDRKALWEAFADALAEKVQGCAKPRPAPTGAKSSALLAAYVVGDAHVGAYAHGEETGGEDFDTGIASADLKGAFAHLVAAAPASEVGMLVNVGDFLHANDTTSLTPASKHLLDTDGRYAQVIERAVGIFRHAIGLMLAKHKMVWIVNARGNHDPDAAIWLNKVLEAYYHLEPRVKVLPNAGHIHYVEWGKCLIGVNHGDKIKLEQLYEAMTRDNREAWGRAKFSYFWTGHLHHHKARELGGCLFETFNTLAAPDAWHASHGYGATREMQQITLHKEYGIVGRNVCGLEMARAA